MLAISGYRSPAPRWRAAMDHKQSPGRTVTIRVIAASVLVPAAGPVGALRLTSCSAPGSRLPRAAGPACADVIGAADAGRLTAGAAAKVSAASATSRAAPP